MGSQALSIASPSKQMFDCAATRGPRSLRNPSHSARAGCVGAGPGDAVVGGDAEQVCEGGKQVQRGRRGRRLRLPSG
eukprot:2299863-Rhodomonas_salina.1